VIMIDVVYVLDKPAELLQSIIDVLESLQWRSYIQMGTLSTLPWPRSGA